jgi:RNA polymerase sigma-70 factor (ECF subfamily)
VIYLIFNEGYATTDGPSLTRADLCAEAIRLGRLVVGLLDEPEAQGLIDQAMATRRVGFHVLQAAIAAAHAQAPSAADTDWVRIVALYDLLLRADPSPVVALNRTAAIGLRNGAQAGLTAIEVVLQQGSLDTYPLAHAARADMQRRLGLVDAASASYRRALVLTRQPAERGFLQRRIDQLAGEAAQG